MPVINQRTFQLSDVQFVGFILCNRSLAFCVVFPHKVYVRMVLISGKLAKNDYNISVMFDKGNTYDVTSRQNVPDQRPPYDYRILPHVPQRQTCRLALRSHPLGEDLQPRKRCSK